MNKTVRAATLIKHENKFLLIQEAAGVVQGRWNWTQGALEKGEIPEEAAVREAKEETGLDIKLIRKVSVIQNPFLDTAEIHVFLGEIVGGELEVQKEEVSDARWLNLNEVEKMQNELVGPWILEVIKGL